MLTLATRDAAGAWATPLFYASDEVLDLFFLSDPGTRHCQAIARDPEVSAAIYGGAFEWSEVTGLQLAGQAWPAPDRLEHLAEHCYGRKFRFAEALIRPGGPHRLYRIRPRWLRLIDNARGLGFKEEVSLGAL